MDSGSRLRVLVAEDHTLVRDGLKRMIGDQPDMVVVGEATSGDEVVAEANRLSPSIVLVDISMPGADGITVAQRLTATCPGARIIAVTRHTDAVFVTRMLRAGAAGYVLKQSPSAELLRAMRAVADGEQYVDAALRVTHAADVPRTTAPSSPDAAREQLTSIEEDVLQLLAHAHSNQEIAHLLRCAVDAVAAFKANAMRKAGLQTRLDVIEYAHQRGWK